MQLEIVYDITDEPWGVRRFYLRDPLGRLVNILSHKGSSESEALEPFLHVGRGANPGRRCRNAGLAGYFGTAARKSATFWA